MTVISSYHTPTFQLAVIIRQEEEKQKHLLDVLYPYFKIKFINTDNAIKIISDQSTIDGIIIVVSPGDESGFPLCLRLKALSETWSIPLLVMGRGNPDEEAQALAVGAVDYICLDYPTSLLIAKLNNHLSLKKYRDSLLDLIHAQNREISLTQEATLLAVAALAESRDPETGGHIQRTQHYVRTLALRLAQEPAFKEILTDSYIDLLFKSAPLHDVGKVAIPDNILLKPSRLTPAEFEMIKKHTTHGWAVLNGAGKHIGANSFLKMASEIALTHHERWDGTGYPRGLSGTDIPLSGRLMALSDVYDALISRRSYKEPYTHKKALEIIQGSRGNHFDPLLTDIFVDIEKQIKNVSYEIEDFSI